MSTIKREFCRLYRTQIKRLQQQWTIPFYAAIINNCSGHDVFVEPSYRQIPFFVPVSFVLPRIIRSNYQTIMKKNENKEALHVNTN